MKTTLKSILCLLFVASSAVCFAQSSGKINGHEYVDLGLSVKWATCNIGASSPSDYGNYYAWGETSTKSEYTERNSKTSYENYDDIGGNSSTDAAKANWGSTWRLPTQAEFVELVENCTWTWTTQGGHKGYKVSSKKNGNSIFLPAAGGLGESPIDIGSVGGYWSSTPCGGDTSTAYILILYDSGYVPNSTGDRNIGLSVRPVSDYSEQSATIKNKTNGNINGHEYIDLGLSVKWATCNVGASSPSDYGNYYAWGETTTKSNYADENSKTYNKHYGNIGRNSVTDAARANWGSTWRLPTKAEFEELANNCIWTWTMQGGINGYKVTSKKNGNSIFLPAAGGREETSSYSVGSAGNYWSSTPTEDYMRLAYKLHLNDRYYDVVGASIRSLGLTVRPVSD